MSKELDTYVDKDVVNHFSGLINDLAPHEINIIIFGKEILDTVNIFNFKELLPSSLKISAAPWIETNKEDINTVNRLINFLKEERSLVTVKKEWLDIKGDEKVSLRDIMHSGANIQVVDNILDAMVIASKKRRNNVVFPVKGYEDEALITAAGLAKAKTVGFRRFYVLQHHRSTPATVRFLACENKSVGFLIPLKTALNTGSEKYSEIPLFYKKGVVFSGYQAAEIMQSIYLLVAQHINKKPEVVFQRTKEVSEDVITRAQWMIDEVFEYEDILISKEKKISKGAMKIREKYKMFDASVIGL